MSKTGTPGKVALTEGLGLVPERAAFETWFSEDGKWPASVRRSGDGYMLAAAQSAWTAWQAATSKAIKAREVSHVAFELCEFIEDIADKPTDSQEVERFKAGQRYAAKSIRKSLGIWLTDEENRRKA